MNNKGFTLIELLAVVVILLGIAGISVVSITSSLKRNDDRECERQEEIIINASKVYFSLNDVDSVTVFTLIEDNYINADDINKYDSNAYVEKNNEYIFHGNCE